MNRSTLRRVSIAAMIFGAVAVLLSAAALVVLSGQAKADAGIRGASSASAVPGSYIVVLKAGAKEPKVDGIRHRLSFGFTLRTTEARARRLAAHPSVDFVQQDQVVRTSGTQYDPVWGLNRIDQRDLPLDRYYRYPDARGAGTSVYVIDTGVQKWHHEISGRAFDGYDFVDGDRVAQDCNGHGTHVAGTAAGNRYGVAKKATVVGVRVLDCAGSGYSSDVVAGVDWVTRNAVKPAVANMSVGGPRDDALNLAVAASVAAGVTYVAAAGNEGVDACETSPASAPAAITVAATDSRDRRPVWSNFGTCVDLFAPGMSIKSAWIDAGVNEATRTISGTSMASPHVAGAAALVLQRFPTYTPAQVTAHLLTWATPNKVIGPGVGSPNKLLYVDR